MRGRARDPAAGGAVPRSLGRGHPPPHVSGRTIRRAASCACAPTSPFRSRATISPRRRPAGRRRSAISARSSATATRRPGRVPPGRHRIVRTHRHRGGRRRDARARPRGDRALRPRPARHPHGRRRAVLGLDRRARPGARLEAPAGEGFQPQEPSRPRSRPPGARQRRTARPNTRACSRRSPIPIPRRRVRWSPTCCRSPASRRSAAARSARSPTASSSRPRSAPAARCRARRAC